MSSAYFLIAIQTSGFINRVHKVQSTLSYQEKQSMFTVSTINLIKNVMMYVVVNVYSKVVEKFPFSILVSVLNTL